MTSMVHQAESLPAIAEIQTSSVYLCRSHAWSSRRVVRVRENMAIKCGRDSELLIEAETMQSLYAHLGASVPCLFSTLVEDCPQEDTPATKCYYLILEYILGKSYLEESPSLTPAEKAGIQQQLRSIMDELRAIPSSGYYVRLGRRPLYDSILNYYDGEGPTMRGPFATRFEEWNSITDGPASKQVSCSRCTVAAVATPCIGTGRFHQLATRRFLHPHIRYPLALRPERGARFVFGAFGDSTILHWANRGEVVPFWNQ